jgi:hypothetical protein
MFHFLKYLILVLILLSLFIFVKSNLPLEIILHFNIPYLGNWETENLSITYLLLIAFALGILFAAFLGALNFGKVRREKKELKEIKRSLSQPQTNLSTDFTRGPSE